MAKGTLKQEESIFRSTKIEDN